MPPDPDNVAPLLQRLFVQHASHVRGFIVALLPDPSLVDDVLQETFLTVTARAGAFDPSRDFVAWACGIARMKVKEAGRRAARLGPQSRRVIELRYQGSHKPEEIARLLQWGVDSVYVALSRARSALRQCMDKKLAAAGGGRA